MLTIRTLSQRYFPTTPFFLACLKRKPEFFYQFQQSNLVWTIFSFSQFEIASDFNRFGCRINSNRKGARGVFYWPTAISEPFRSIFRVAHEQCIFHWAGAQFQPSLRASIKWVFHMPGANPEQFSSICRAAHEQFIFQWAGAQFQSSFSRVWERDLNEFSTGPGQIQSNFRVVFKQFEMNAFLRQENQNSSSSHFGKVTLLQDTLTHKFLIIPTNFVYQLITNQLDQKISGAVSRQVFKNSAAQMALTNLIDWKLKIDWYLKGFTSGGIW